MGVLACLVKNDFESLSKKFAVGDRVEGNWKMKGTYYSGFVKQVSPASITMQYDDDGSVEALPIESVRKYSMYG